MRRPALLAFVMAITSLLAVVPAHAGRLANVEIHDRNTGQTLPVYSHQGRLYVPGEPKHEYEIRVRNTSGGRLLAVTSVDGVNVISGDTASPDQTGYVLDGYGSVEIAGWRKSMDRIATFFFTKLKDSYAARTERPHDVGVIGVALFREKQKPRCCWPWASNSAREDRAPEPASAPPERQDLADQGQSLGSAQPRAKAESKLGTGHGRSELSEITYTDFERASDTPDEVISIFYDSRRNLVAQGVLPVYSRNERYGPNPFPNGFVPDP